MELDEASPPRWGMGDVVLGLVAWIGLSLVGLVAVALATGSSSWAAVGSQVGGVVGMVGVALWAVRRKGSGSPAADLGFRFRWWDALLGPVVGVAAMMAGGIVAAMLMGILGVEEPATNTTVIYGRETDTAALVVIVGLATLAAPVVEELFFRGLLLRSVTRRFGTGVAIAATSAVFSLLHAFGLSEWSLAAIPSFAVLATLGAAFALVTVWQRRLGPAVIAHVTVNTIATVAYFALRAA